MHSSQQLRDKFNSFLKNYHFTGSPSSLYDPVNYIMQIGGKRIRPILVLLASELFGGNIDESMKAAFALEVFHNFTLVHDDIMDEADTRRGQLTVHKKYSENSAILSGDLMLIKAYELLGQYEDVNVQVALFKIFNKLAVELCEGQEWDMKFEQIDNVSVDDYLNMVTLKTGVLIAGALQMGALLGGGSVANQEHIYAFGKNIGIAFQLQDDLLDAFGTYEKLGKKIGGDIAQNKKTYLYLKAIELADEGQKTKLQDIFMDRLKLPEVDKIETVVKLFDQLVVAEYARQVRDAYLDLAYAHLAAIDVPEENKESLKDLAKQLVNRES